MLSSTLALSTAACSKDKRESEASTATSATESTSSARLHSPVTLKLLFLQTKPAEMDKVLAEFEKRTKDTLNTKLDIEFAGSELTLKLD